MSETQQETEPAEQHAEQQAERKQMTLQERVDVIDYLRARSSPIVGDTKADVARQISASSGVEVTSAQVDYLIASLPKLDLGNKIQVGPVTNASLAAEIKALSNRLDKLAGIVDDDVSALEDRVETLENQLKASAGLHTSDASADYTLAAGSKPAP